MDDFDIVRDVILIISSIVTIVCLIIITFILTFIAEKLDTATNCITYNGHRYCMEEVE